MDKGDSAGQCWIVGEFSVGVTLQPGNCRQGRTGGGLLPWPYGFRIERRVCQRWMMMPCANGACP